MAEREPTAPPRGNHWSLQREFTRLLILAVLLPAFLLAGLALWHDVNLRQQQLSNRMGAAAQFSARNIDLFLLAHRGALELVADRRSSEGTLDHLSAWGSDLARLRKHYPGFVTLLVSDGAGVVRLSEPMLAVAPKGTRRVDDRAYFREPARTGLPYVSDVFRGRTQGTDPLVAVSAPLTADGRFAGVLEGSIRVDTFARINAELLQQRGYSMLLLDRHANVIHASDGLPFAPVAGLGEGGPAQAIRALSAFAVTNEAMVMKGLLPGGADAYAVQTPLQAGWRLVLLTPVEVITRESRRQSLALLVLLALAVLAGLAASWRQLRLLNRSVDQLLQTLQRFALDDVAAPIGPDAMPRELAPLASALNETSGRLGMAYRAVSQSLEEQTRLRASLELAVEEREREICERTTELREAVTELDRLSRTDALTGCLNYRGFREALATLCEQARASGRPLGILAMDIDHFKAYNDHYGHQAGDSALLRFAGAIRSALFHHDDVLARPGGEEFVVLLPATDMEQTQHAGERVRLRVRDAEIAHAAAPAGILTVSVGIAVIEPGDCDDPDAVLRRADAALYRAKHAGRDRVCG